MDMVEGHPALINIAFYHLSREDITRSKLLATAPTATGIYDRHLQRHWVTLQQQPELAQALNQVMTATSPILLDPILTYKLIRFIKVIIRWFIDRFVISIVNQLSIKLLKPGDPNPS